MSWSALAHVNPRRPHAIWYVDNSVGSSGNGQSWATAWKDFSNIVWASVNPGDTIRVSGGASGQTYNAGALSVPAVGASGNPVIITGATDNGHNGPVTLDGSSYTTQNSSTSIVNNSGSSASYWTLQNFVIQNTLENCVYISGISAGQIIIQNNTIHTGSGTITLTTNATTAAGNATLHFASVPAALQSLGSGNFGIWDSTNRTLIPADTTNSSQTATTIVMNNNAAGAGVGSGDTITIGVNARAVRVGQITGTAVVIIRNNVMDTPASTPAQTDGIFSYLNTGTVILSGNTITINNSDPSGHSDGWQSQQDTNITVTQNTIKVPNGGTNNHGINVNDPGTGGALNFTNNVVVMGNAVGAYEIAVLLQTLDTGFTGTGNIYNNTIVNGLNGVYIFEPSFHATWNVKNNIIYQPSGTPYVIGSAGVTANIDYNCVMTSGAQTTIASNNGSNQTWAQWQSAGKDTNGVNSDPLFVTAVTNLLLQSGSPAKNAGTTLGAVTVDNLGYTRPQGTSYCMGAYEYPL